MVEEIISNVAQVERAKSGKIYPAGCTLIALSATKGEVEYLEKDGEVETRYAVLIPDREKVLGKFLHISVCQYFQEFLYKHRTGINLQFGELEQLKIGIYDMEQQRQIVQDIGEIMLRIEQEEKAIEQAKEWKRAMLGRMFPE